MVCRLNSFYQDANDPEPEDPDMKYPEDEDSGIQPGLWPDAEQYKADRADLMLANTINLAESMVAKERFHFWTTFIMGLIIGFQVAIIVFIFDFIFEII